MANARNMFQAQTHQGQSAAGAAADRQTATTHGNLVCAMRLYEAGFGGQDFEFTTSALDGKIAFWTRDELTAAMGALAIS